MLPPSLEKRPYLVISNQMIASGIFELRLKPESHANRVPLPEAGQWVYLELSNEAGEASGLRRAYSIASAPSEIEAAEGEICFGIKAAGEVSGALEKMKTGDRLWLQGPFGRFVISHESHPVIFIAGGIGMTPLHSMLVEGLKQSPERKFSLLISCRTQEEIPYQDKWASLAATYPSFSYLATCTRETSESWKGSKGRISEEMLRDQVARFPDADIFLCGPNLLMEELSALLKQIGVEPKKIHTEKFG